MNATEPQTNPEAFKQLGEDLRHIAVEALRGIPSPDSLPYGQPKVTVSCDIESTIAQIDVYVEELRQELQYDDANPFDKLLIEQILVAWVQWYVAGWLLDGELAQKRSWRENQYFTQRYQQCQSRLTRAIAQLSKLRLIHPCRLRIQFRADGSSIPQRRTPRKANLASALSR